MSSNRANERMNKPNDARALRSRRALQMALLALLEERPFHEITIRDITNRAGVSYPVFFRRYAAKGELLSDIAAVEVQRLLDAAYPSLSPESPRQSIEHLCTYVREHRALWKALLKTEAASAMRTEFARIAAEIGNAQTRSNPALPVALTSSFVAAGVFEILSWWLDQAEDYPVANVVTLFDVLLVRPTLTPQDIELI